MLALLSWSDHRWLHKNFGNATLWAYINNKVTLDEICSWCRDSEKAKILLQTNIITQKTNQQYII